MSKYGSANLKVLKSKSLNSVHPNIIAVIAKKSLHLFCFSYYLFFLNQVNYYSYKKCCQFKM